LTGTRLPYDQQQAPEPEGDNTSSNSSSSSSGGEDNDSSHGSSISEPPMTELQQRFLTIVDIVDNLYKLSRMIRTPALQTRFSKAAAFKKIDRETGIDLIVKFRATDHEYVMDAFRSLRRENGSSGSQLLPQDLEFVRRVADGITKRRQQFMYWKRHRDKLGIFARKEDFEISAVVRPEMSVLPSGESATHHSQSQPRNLPLIPPSKHQFVHDTSMPGSIGKTDLTATTATIFIPTDNFSESGQTTTSFATTARGLDGNRIELPSLPKSVILGKDFECSYCFAIVPARYQSERGWRAHVLRDLKPYVCTYPSCPKPEVLFSDRKSWIEHEQWEHRGVWSCPEHFDQSFQVAEDFRCHLEEQPHKVSEGLSSSALIDIGKSFKSDYRTNCVVCLAVCNTAEMLQNHTANHLERFAAFSLPRDVDNSDNDSDLSKGPNSNSGESQAKSDDLLEPQMLSISAKTELIRKSLERINEFRNGLDEITTSNILTSETGQRLQILITALESVVNQMSQMLKSLHEYSDSHLVSSDPEGLNDVVSRMQRLQNMLDSVRLEDFLTGTTLDDITEKLASDAEMLSTFLASVKSRVGEPQTPFVEALFDFKGQDPEDLDFKKGDIIVVLETKYREWWKGWLRSKVGVFPVNRVTPTRRSTTTDFNHMARAETESYAALEIAEKLTNFLRLGKDYITEEQEELMPVSIVSQLIFRSVQAKFLRNYTHPFLQYVNHSTGSFAIIHRSWVCYLFAAMPMCV
jgi:hypothetical protein